MNDPLEIIEHLAPADALSILKKLARGDAALAARIAEMALADLEDTDPEGIAIQLYDELDALEVEEVWDRAGETRNGYVETDEVAYEMIKEVMSPFLDELRWYQKMRLNDKANQLCMGLLLGLYRFEHESTSEFKDWSPDAPIAFAEAVVDAWQEGSPTREDVRSVKTFSEEELGWWSGGLFEGDKQSWR